MNYKTHMIGGLTVGVAAILKLEQPNLQLEPLFILAGSFFGSILPDIDHPKSYLGSKIPILPSFINKNFGHRTVTHSIFFPLLVWILLSNYNFYLSQGLILGIMSHILLDIITKQGVCIFYPISRVRCKTPILTKLLGFLFQGNRYFN